MCKRICTNCKKEFDIVGKDTMRICKECNVARVKCMSVEYKMRNRAHTRSKIHNVPFNIEVSDIVVPDICPILGITLVVKKGTPGGLHNSPSLHRIIPEKGYTKGNIVVISHLANMMLSNVTTENLLKFATWIQKTYTDSGES